MPGPIDRGEKPICVISCPLQAIDVGPLDELRAKYGDVRETEGFTYSEELNPSITFKSQKGCPKALPLYGLK